MSKDASIDEISQPTQSYSHYQKLQWLQKRRTLGLYVQCDECNRWRYLPNILDRHQLSRKWYCRMNADRSKASCSEPEVPVKYSDLEDLIHSEYSSGSLVVARLPGWPWWPAMVDDCPDTEQYYWLDGFSDIPTHYNVVFFDAHDVTRAWLAPNQLKPYAEAQKVLKKSLKNKTYQKRISVAMQQADEAEVLPLNERLAKYSFIAKYRGNILSPKKITRSEAQKYQESFKRKYNIELPFETDSEEDDLTLSEHVKNKEDSNKTGESQNNTIIDEMNTNCSDEISILNKSLSVTIDANNNVEALKNTLTNGSIDDQVHDHRMPTPPSDDFDFKM